MDGDDPTQATQNVLDPRRVGNQNSGFSDDDISDIVCVLYPHSPTARREVERLAAGDSPLIIGKGEADENVEPDYELEDHASRFETGASGHGNYAIILRLSAPVKNPKAGFVFGRNKTRCDVVLEDDPLRRISNIHFRIYVNEYGSVMVEDQSTNGTFVDTILLTPKPESGNPVTKYLLSSGSMIRILLHHKSRDVSFRVRIPRRDDSYATAYQQKVEEYFARHGLQGINNAPTAHPANGRHVDVFKAPAQLLAASPAKMTTQLNARPLPQPPQQQTLNRTPSKRKETKVKSTEWRGSGNYNKIGTIGRGAFAVVYKVTAKFDGRPYAAKELDKRRFMKNGILDQKVETEMKIMQKVSHPNIVRYIENFDWEDRLLIIIMEYIEGGDLGKAILEDGPFPEDMVQSMSTQLLSALGYLHANSITHRDVKPDNILISSLHPLEVKLTDFGLSKMVENEQTFLRTFCGTLLYCAPEVYTEYAEYDDNGIRSRGHRRRPPGQRYNHAVDIWSLGGVIFYTLTKCPPYPVKSGISPSELLHKIMTTRLDISPLQVAGVSERGIDFISRMLQRRPENRATITELDSHSWLGGPGSIIDASQSYDVITDDEEEGIVAQGLPLDMEDDRISDSVGDISDAESKENHPEMYPMYRAGEQPQRLFGEVGVSAIGSSGVIPEDFLNLPEGDVSMGETEILDNSFGDLDTPTATRVHQRHARQTTLSIAANQSADQMQSLVEKAASQSLGGNDLPQEGASSSHYYSVDFNASKRKPPPSNDTSDEFGENASYGIPSLKRLKSEGNIEEVSDEALEECRLLACMPGIRRLGSGRQIDGPVSKMVFWEQDRSTWHLHYPEMTQLQQDAFSQAAATRGEEFRSQKTPLWDLAMRYFPPSLDGQLQPGNGSSPPPIPPPQRVLRRDESRLDEMMGEFPPTAPPGVLESQSIPDTAPPNSQFVVPVQSDATAARAVGMIESHPQSMVSGISFPITDALVSFGRGPDNTQIFEPKTEPRVPKYAFKILLWKDGDSYDPSKNPKKSPHPWYKDEVLDQSSYSFWISTKATIGIKINGWIVPSSDAKNHTGPSQHWTRLYNGDNILIWGTHDHKDQTTVTFRCFWGASSHPRPGDAKLEMASSEVAAKLDAACQRTEQRIKHSLEKRRMEDAAKEDFAKRQRNVDKERERSRAFEMRRQEAVEFLQARQHRASTSMRRASPASAPPMSINPFLGSARLTPVRESLR